MHKVIDIKLYFQLIVRNLGYYQRTDKVLR